MNQAHYKVKVPAYAGPLDLLLHLIERQELDITAISLTQVTEQYLAQIEQLKANRVENLIDFLVVGARLALIKSRALLPQSPVTVEGEDEEDPAEALLRQLRLYRQYRQAAEWLQAREKRGLRTYLRVAPPPKLEAQLDLTGINIDTLAGALRNAFDRADNREESVALVRPRQFTIEGQIRRLRQRVGAEGTLLFTDILSSRTSRLEIALTLLALLELIKRGELQARQTALFGPIEIWLIPAGANDRHPASQHEEDQ